MASPSIFVFNEAYYLAQNSDVDAAVKAGAYKSGLEHWQAFGASEGRLASAFFDLQTYKDNNPDLSAENGFVTDADYVRHFTTYGVNEDRIFLSPAVFNADIYAAQNPDLEANGISGRLALEQHFRSNGVYEGRVSKADFDPVAYINAETDLKALLDAGGNIGGYGKADIVKAGWFHYLNWGIGEGRPVPAPNPTVTVTPGSSFVTEGQDAVFTVTLSIPLSHDVTYTFNVTGDTKGGALNAASASDFGSVTGQVTIPAGSTSWQFKVTPTADGVTEGLEGFKVTLFDINLTPVKTSDVVGITDAAAPVTPKTITLTTGADAGTAFVGDTANDTFIGAFNLTAENAQDTTTTTLTAGDSLVGGAGTDTLSISVAGGSSGTASGSVTPTLIGIERIVVSSSLGASGGTGSTASFDLSLTDSALTNISVASSVNAASTLEFANLQKLVAVDAKGAGNVSLNFATSVVSGSGDALALSLGGVGSSGALATYNANGIEVLNIASSGAGNFVQLGTGISSNDKPVTVNVSGPAATTLNLGAGTAITAVNGSGLTAALTVNSISGDHVTITGGSGDDTFDFGTGFNAATVSGGSQLDVINGGAGRDTLKINAASTVADAAFGNVSSIEVLSLSGSSAVTLGAAAQTAGIVSVTESGSGNVSLVVGTGYTGSLAVTLGGSTGTDSVVVSASGSATVTVNATVTSAGAGLTGTTITAGTGTGQTSDTLVITASGTGALAATLSSGITGVDKIVVQSTGGATGLTLTTHNDNVAASGTLVVDGGALGTGFGLTLNSTAETNGKLLVTGGAGADTITLGSGNNTVFGGAGNDTIDASAGGNNVLSGGDGDDTFILSGALTSGVVIDGGSGTDTLYLSSGTVTSAMLTGVVNVERLVFSGEAILNSPIQFNTFDLSANSGADTLTLASGYTGATTVTLGSGDTVVNTGANVALTVNVTDAAMGAAGTQVIFGGSGTDTLNLTGATAGISGSATAVTLHAASNVEIINIIDAGDGSGTGATGAGKDVSLTLASGYAKSVTVDASSLDAGASGLDETFTFNASLSSGTVTVTGGAAADSITGSSGNDVLSGGAGNDLLIAGSGFDRLDGGDGDDTLSFGLFFDGNDTVAGGSGTDTLSVDQTSGLGDLAFLNVTSVERLSLADNSGQVTLDTRAQAAGINTVVLASGGEDVKVNAAGFSTGVNFLASANSGDVSLVGGAGNDVFTFTGDANLNSADKLVGGSGYDTVVIGNGAGTSGSGVAFEGTLGSGVVGIEQITVVDAATGTGSTGTVTLTLNSGFNSGAAVLVDAQALNGTGESFSFTNEGSGRVTVLGGAGSDEIYGGSAADSISGGAGNDYIDGGAGNDVLVGGDGDDTLVGGSGVDTLTGGAGNDVFVVSPGTSTSTGVDVITDFSSGDVIRLDLTLSGDFRVDNTFKGASGTYAEALSLLTGQNGTNRGQYVYITSTNQLVVDVDGNGLLQGDDLYLTLQGTTGLTTSAVALNLTVGDSSGTGVVIGGATNRDTVNHTGTGTVELTSVENYNGDGATYNYVVLKDATAIAVSDTSGLTLTGFSGADTIAVKSAVTNHTYDLGSGNDTITFSGAVTSATITGGAGNDTVTFLSTGGNTARLSDVETVVGSSGVDAVTLSGTTAITVTDNGGGFTVTGAVGADTITIGSGNTGAITVVDSSGGFTINGSTGADSISLSGTGSGTVVGGDGNDTLTLSVATTGVVFSGGSGDDSLVLTSGSTGVVYTGGAGTDTLTFSGTGNSVTVNGINTITVAAASGINNVTLGDTGGFTLVSSGTGSYAIVTGSAGADVVTLSGATGAIVVDDVSGGFTVSGSIVNDYILVANTGALTVVDNGGGLFIGGSGTTNTENVTLSGTSTAVSVSDSGGLFTLTATSGNDNITFSGMASGASFNFSLGSGDDTLTVTGSGGVTGSVDGGSGTDALVFASSGQIVTITNIDSVTGSSGVNTVVLGNAGSDVILVGGATHTGATTTFTSWTSGDVIDLGTGGADTIVVGTGFETGLNSLVFSGFDAGATTGDVLNVDALADGSLATGFGSGSGLVLSTASGAASFDVGIVYGNSFGTGNIGTATGAINFSTGGGHIVLLAASGAASSFQVYLVDSTLDGTGGSFSSGDINLIGTVHLAGSDTVNDLDLSNFVF